MDRFLGGLLLIGMIIISITTVLLVNLENSFEKERIQQITPIEKNTKVISNQGVITIGILHPLTGTMAISEKPVVDATLLAIDEINHRGGILGKQLVPIIYDGESDWPTFAKRAEQLIVNEEASVVFGGWTSASRKTMLPVFEKYDHLLFYPVQYEGLEQSPNIVYTGAAPNQQVIPAVEWAFGNIGTKFFLVGSDYVFPRSANEIIKEKVSELGGTIVGEEYQLLGNDEFLEIVDKIIASKPDVIINTINGDSNVPFFKTLRELGITPQIIPTISLSISENEIMQMDVASMVGDYAVWNYFQSLDTPSNSNFVNNFKKKYGSDRVTSDPMEAAYLGVYIYAKAAESVESIRVSDVRNSVRGVTLSAPEGVVGVDPESQHLSKVIRVGQIQEDGQFKIVSSSEEPIRPVPYHDYKTKDEWNAFLDDMYLRWGNSWSNPGMMGDGI